MCTPGACGGQKKAMDRPGTRETAVGCHVGVLSWVWCLVLTGRSHWHPGPPSPLLAPSIWVLTTRSTVWIWVELVKTGGQGSPLASLLSCPPLWLDCQESQDLLLPNTKSFCGIISSYPDTTALSWPDVISHNYGPPSFLMISHTCPSFWSFRNRASIHAQELCVWRMNSGSALRITVGLRLPLWAVIPSTHPWA